MEGVTLLGKAEWANPGGSVKDRAAASMIQDARARGLLAPGKTLLDASSGNTRHCAGHARRRVGLPRHADHAFQTCRRSGKRNPLHAYGATVDWTDPNDGSDGAIRRAREMAGNDPARFCYVDQYSNDANCWRTTAPPGRKFWRQTDGQVTHFVAGGGHQRHADGHRPPPQGIQPSAAGPSP